MIKLENTDKAIKGLAKLIAQDPTYPSKLRTLQYEFLEAGIIKYNKEHLAEQENILKKAEEIGLSDTGYVFNIDCNDKKYMLYKKVDSRMVVLSEGIGIEAERIIEGFEDLKKYLEKFKIKKLISFEPSDQDSFYSQPWHEGENEEDFNFGHITPHNEAYFNEKQKEELNEKGIELFYMEGHEAWKFNLDLEDIN